MEETDIQKYVLDQANIEVEHNRSWPTKVMAFYIAINFGLAGALITLKNGNSGFVIPCVAKTVITILLLGKKGTPPCFSFPENGEVSLLFPTDA